MNATSRNRIGTLLWRSKIVFGWSVFWLACVTGCSAADTTDLPADSVKWLVNAYTRADDRSWGPVEVEKAEKGQSYVSRGEHDIRAGVAIEPTRVTFTGWGFAPDSGRLGHFRAVCTWFCYTNDFGDKVALPDQHTVTPILGTATKGKDVPDLGELGLSPQQMERVCGTPVQPPTPEPKHEGVTRIRYHKDGYDLSGLFYAGKVYSIVYSRSDKSAITDTDIITWLLQNGSGWKHETRAGYTRTDNSIVAHRYNAGSDDAAKLDCLEVREAKTHPEGPVGEDFGSPVGRYKKVVSDAVQARWYSALEEHMSELAGAGEVKIHFGVTATGRVSNVKVVSGDARSSLAQLSVAVVKEAELPAIPAEVSTTLDGKPFEADYTFSLK